MSAAHLPNPVLALLGGALESVLNRVLALDPDSAARIAALEGAAIELTWSGPDIGMRVTVRDGRLTIGPRASEPDLSVKSTLAGLVGMVAPWREKAGLPAGKVQMAGDAELARRLAALAEKFEPQIDDALRERFGDAGGTAIGRALREGAAWAKTSAGTLAQDAADYVRDESGDVVSREELDTFFDEVDTLRDRGERLAQRVAALVAKVPIVDGPDSDRGEAT
jgi:ubiquinone biosynthesis accessory factor UbiJ